MLSDYGKREWLAILAIGSILTVTFLVMGWWWSSLLTVVAVGMGLCFFRDPHRRIPTERGVMVSPADGRVSSIHHVEYFEPLNGASTCIRIFLSVANVHVNRSPCHGLVKSIVHKDGQHLNALNPRSAEVNESNLILLLHPTHRYPVAAVRQVAGLIARTIVCGVQENQIVQRGQRVGMIKFGSTTELYVPESVQPQVAVRQGQRVFAGSTVIATVTPPSLSAKLEQNGQPQTTSQ